MSIDRLLHRTVKHLLFLQGVTRHAQRFEQMDEAKVINSLSFVFFLLLPALTELGSSMLVIIY